MFCKQRILMTCYCCTLCRGTQRKSDGYWFIKNLERWEELGEFNACFLDAFIWVNINYPGARQRGHIRTKQTTSVPKTISHNVSNIRITDWLPCKFRWILISCQCLKGIPTISCATIVVVLVVVWTILIVIDFVLGVDGPWGRCTPVMAVVVVVRGSWWSVWEYF